MFKLILAHHQLKVKTRNFIINYLNKTRYLPKQISYDVLDTLSNKNTSMYRLYLKDSPIGEDDLERMIQARRNNYTRVNEVDLHHLYDITLDYLQVKFALCPSIRIVTYNHKSVKYFEVHKK